MIDSSIFSQEDMKELLALSRDNNRMLKELLIRLRGMDSSDRLLKQYATNFGVSLCSTIVGDKILGLRKNNS